MTAMQTVNSDLILRNRRRIKSYTLATASVIALSLMAQNAVAQEQVAQASSDQAIENVTVTGTRVVRDGYSAPTPVSVLSAQDIEQNPLPNIADFVNEMPAVSNSTTPDNSSVSLSAGTAGINAINLRDLGAVRTLVMVDSHRVSASSTANQIDVNTIPQQLVSRVDIVTGGASADYGSDAVSGVVNFILDKTFTGLKGDFQYGQTSDNLQPNETASLTYGTDFDGDRGHFLVSGEWFNEAPINNYVPKWMQGTNYFTIQNPAYTATNGQPYYLVTGNVSPSEVAPGGLVISGPLNGTYFGVNAVVGQLAYGQISGPWMLGGDPTTTYQDYAGTESYSTGQVRDSIYTRGSYKLTPDIEVYGEFSNNRSKGYDTYIQPVQVGGITILSGNPYLPASIQSLMIADKQTSLSMGSTNMGFPEAGARNARDVTHIAGGVDGDFHILTDWTYDLYGQANITSTREQELPTWNTAALNNATNAVYAPAGNALGVPAGTIVCASSLTNPTNGCAPLSRIGIDGGLQSAAAYQAGLNYVFANPYRLERLNEADYTLNITGDPFSDWQGPVSVAFGGEWRLESVNGQVPAQYQSGWDYGNYLVNHGHYSVGEGYIETVIPLLPGLDSNDAIRYTAYSTSGGVQTWKTGLTYAPDYLPDVKLRGTYSHDIRAPTLADLFATGTATTNAILINNVSYPLTYETTGNSNLVPESSNTAEVGAVFTPTFIDGFTASIDYFNINIKKAISTLAIQNATDLCYKSDEQAFCNNIVYVNGVTATPTNYGPQIKSFILQPFNFASQKTQGIDFDLTYQVPLDSFPLFAIPGDLTLRGSATNTINNITNNGVTAPTNSAGVNASGGEPSWVYRLTQTYKDNSWTLTVVERGFSSGVYANEYTQCLSACPPINNPYYTTNDNHLPGGFYLDTTVNYAFIAGDVESELFFSVKNLLDTNPALVGNGPSSVATPGRPETNINLYDYLGRVLRMGIRFNM